MDTGLRLAIIAAVSDNNIIGRNGEIPWRLRSDLQRFAQLTKGHAVIVGRKTHESIVRRLGHPLKDRETIILTRSAGYGAPNCFVTDTWGSAMEIAQAIPHRRQAFVIGGEELYRRALPIAKEMFLTTVHTSCDGDTFFPAYNPADWEIVKSSCLDEPPDGDAYPSTFQHLRRLEGRLPVRRPPFVLLYNARLPEQERVMAEIEEHGECPFCTTTLAQSTLSTVVWQGRYWHVRPNRWPYPGTRLHLLVILNEHAERLTDLTPEALVEFVTLLQWLEHTYHVESGSVGVRFGDPRGNGATVNHLHAHFIVANPDVTAPDYQPVRFRMGPKPVK